MAHALELKLGSAGFETTVAKDGEETLATMGKETFDLILLDLIMPKKDGFAVLKELKAKGDKTPVIVLTNLGQEEDARRVKELGAIGFFVKADTQIANLVKEVEKALPSGYAKQF